MTELDLSQVDAWLTATLGVEDDRHDDVATIASLGKKLALSALRECPFVLAFTDDELRHLWLAIGTLSDANPDDVVVTGLDQKISAAVARLDDTTEEGA